MLAVDDRVVTRYVARGTHRGEYMGAAPSGGEVAFTGIDVVRLEGGKIVEGRGNGGRLGLHAPDRRRGGTARRDGLRA